MKRIASLLVVFVGLTTFAHTKDITKKSLVKLKKSDKKQLKKLFSGVKDRMYTMKKKYDKKQAKKYKKRK